MLSKYKPKVARFYKLAFYPCFGLTMVVPGFYRLYRFKAEQNTDPIEYFRIWDYHTVLYLLFSIPSFLDLILFCLPLKTFADLINYWYMKKTFDNLENECSKKLWMQNYSDPDKFMLRGI